MLCKHNLVCIEDCNILLQTDGHTDLIEFGTHVELRLAQINIILVRSFLWDVISTHKVHQSTKILLHSDMNDANVDHCHFVLLQTGGQYFAEEQRHLGVPPLNLTQLEYAQYCYDATWTLAYALNQTMSGNIHICTHNLCVRKCMHVCVMQGSSKQFQGDVPKFYILHVVYIYIGGSGGMLPQEY